MPPKKRQIQHSLFQKAWHSYSHLDLSDKVGVILILLTGVGLLALLFSGKDFLQLPIADAKPANKHPSRLPPGCEYFKLNSDPSPLDPGVKLVVLGEQHEKHEHTNKCIDAIATARRNPTYTIHVEGIPNGVQMPCSMVPGGYPQKAGIACIGWDAIDSFQKEEAKHFASGFAKILKAIITTPQLSSTFSSLKNLSEKQAKEQIAKITSDITRANRRTLTELKTPTVLLYSPESIQFMRDRSILQEIEEFAWTCYKKGFLPAVTGYKSKFEELKKTTEHTVASMTHRNLGLVTTIEAIVKSAHERSTTAVDAHGDFYSDKSPSSLTFLVAGQCHVNPCSNPAVRGSEEAAAKTIQESKDSVSLLVMHS